MIPVQIGHESSTSDLINYLLLSAKSVQFRSNALRHIIDSGAWNPQDPKATTLETRQPSPLTFNSKMNSDYPPLPPSRGPGPELGTESPSTQTRPLREAANTSTNTPSVSSEEVQARESTSENEPQQYVMVLSSHGDVIVEYADRDQDGLPSASFVSRWLVASEDLIQNSPYFRALLDPNKFSEGRNFMKQKAGSTAAAESETNGDENAAEQPLSMLPSLLTTNKDALRALPTLSLPVDQVTRRLGVNTIELFLRVLSYHSLDNGKKHVFDEVLKQFPPSNIARLIHLADTFNSPQVVREALKRSGYAYGKGRVSLTKLNQSLLKMSEDRIRHIIYIAHFLNEQTIYQVMTHTLIVLGSKYWVNGVEAPSDPEDGTLRWQYFADGLEGILNPLESLIILLVLTVMQKNYSTDVSTSSTQLQTSKPISSALTAP